MRRAAFIELVAVELDLPLFTASRIVDIAVPEEAYGALGDMPIDDVEGWLALVREDQIHDEHR